MNPTTQQKGINLVPKDYIGNILMTNNLTGQKYIATPNPVQQQQANALKQGINPTTGTSIAPTGQNATTGSIATIGDILGSTAQQDKELQSALGEKNALTTAVSAGTYDDPVLRAQKQAEIQRQIDATSAVFATKRKELEKVGESRLGQLGSIQARRGILGSNIASGQEGDVRQANAETLNALENERLASIIAIERAGNQELRDEMAKRSQSAIAGADAKIAEIQGRKDRSNEMAKNKAKALLSAGFSSKNLTKDQITQAIGSNPFITADQVITEFLSQESEKTKQSIADQKNQSFELGEGQARYTIDPVTGEAKLIAQRAKTYAPSTSGTTLPSNPAVDAWVNQINTGRATLSNVPASIKNAVVTALNTSAPAQDTSYQTTVLKNALKNAESLKGASGPSAITRYLGDTFVGDTDFKQLSAYIDTIKANLLTLVTDPSIRKFFGPQMSNRDVELMTSVASSLDPQRLSPEQIQAEITQINDFLNRYESAKRAKESYTQTTVPTGNTQVSSDPLGLFK